MGETLFVQPLEQAWQRVLLPAAANLNNQWQRAVVNEWHGAFDGRYPFVGTDSDASLPMLGQMIRAGSGRIDPFYFNQKERWQRFCWPGYGDSSGYTGGLPKQIFPEGKVSATSAG